MNSSITASNSIAEEDILSLSSSSGNRVPFSHIQEDDDAKLHVIPSKQSRSYHKQNKDEHQSDFLDSLQMLSISLDEEIQLINTYFHDISINKNNRDLLLFEDEPTIPSMLHDAIIIEVVILVDEPHEIASNPVELSIKCSKNYPLEAQSCHCRTVCCPFITNSECMVFKNKLNAIAQQLTKENHNCIIMMLIELEKRVCLLNNKAINISNTEYVMSKRRHQRSASALGSMSILNDSGFFDSLNSLHDVSTAHHNNKEKQEHILPSSFIALQDIQTTKTWDEKKVEDEYALIDGGELCPALCGAVWGGNGQLIFFNNILLRRHRNGRKLELHQERDAMISLHDYNKYIEKCGADGIHSQELHSIRKRVFANHFDEDEDRFTDEIVVGFSLYHKTNIKKPKRKHSYKNAYLHRSVSFLRRQHHQNHHKKKDHLPHIPHLILPQTLHVHQDIHRKHHRKKRYRSDRYKVNTSHAHHVVPKQGNARIFCPGIIRFVVRFPFSKELVSRHKLVADQEYNVASLCIYNANQCQYLGLNRLSSVLHILSTFLETASCNNMLIPSPYHDNYVAKFVKKAIDELYLHNEIQGIAIIACLLRHSQFFVLLCHQNCGYLLQSCVAQYLRIIKDRIDIQEIKDINQLQNFAHLLQKQKNVTLSPNNDDEETVIITATE